MIAYTDTRFQKCGFAIFFLGPRSAHFDRTPDGHLMPDQLSIDSLIEQARDLMRQRDYPQAVAVYRSAIEQNDMSVAAHEGLAAAAFMMQDYDLAVKHFKRVSMLDPRRAEPLINLGAVYNRKCEYQSAVKQLRHALSKDRKSAEAYYNLGIAYRGMKSYSMAISAYREAIRLKPDMSEAYQNLANAYVEQGNTQQAILNYRRALELRPGFERARRGLEQAQNAASEAKKSMGPFGRLVDPDQPTIEVKTASHRALTPQERFEDRTQVHQCAKVVEQSAAVLLNQLRDRLIECLLKLNHAFSQSDDRYDFKEEYFAYRAAHAEFQRAVEMLSQQSNALRAHEKFIRS
jgi:tetratricopeptide (TPR) repeat protein